MDYSPDDPASIAAYAKQLEGMTFRDVLDLGIVAEGVSREYSSKRYKGGLGTLLEERFFGYKANSDRLADFPEAGVELKTTCLDMRSDGSLTPGERLVITMIPLNEPIAPRLSESHVWEKIKCLLLVFYERDRSKDGYDQIIRRVGLFTPPDDDLKIIEDDYNKIAAYVQEGRAQELSEGMTTYLGACTKGSREADMWVDQFYPPHAPAKRRAFCFKRSYMVTVFNALFADQADRAEPIIKDPKHLDGRTFDELVLSTINEHIGKTDRELCSMLEIPYTGKKRQWSQIVYALLGVRSGRAEEFEKANISIRAVRLEENGTLKESLSLDTFRFKEIVGQDWESSRLRAYFEETRFLFIVFEKAGGDVRLAGARFWSMPVCEMDGPLRACWERTRDVIERGVKLRVDIRDDGRVEVRNDLPKMGDAGSIAHVRPHASKSGYRFENGDVIGDPDRYGDELPDGRVMTKQSFWLNRGYVYEIISLDEEDAG